MLTFIAVLAVIVQAETSRRNIMAKVEEVLAAVAAARAEIEADKQAILAEIARLGLPDEDLAPVLEAVAALGTVLDDVPGVTPPAEEEPDS